MIRIRRFRLLLPEALVDAERASSVKLCSCAEGPLPSVPSFIAIPPHPRAFAQAPEPVRTRPASESGNFTLDLRAASHHPLFRASRPLPPSGVTDQLAGKGPPLPGEWTLTPRNWLNRSS